MSKNEHYFTEEPTSRSEPHELVVQVRKHTLTLTSDRGVFSHAEADKGTLLLAAKVQFGEARRVLDLGCGYGLLGIVAALECPDARVTFVDTNQRAVGLAKLNAERLGLRDTEFLTGDAPAVLGDRIFDLVMCNPPYAAGKKVFMPMLTDAAARLSAGGSLWIVGRTKQGIKTLTRDLSGLFETVETADIKGGYRVIRLATAPT
ncbi:MAG: class I SAM-dependent methyltransferase [Armatimonadetes bacterium]|nr:class I SAM-dependent methyltransferase [Armatimonadota bacterium]